MQRFLLAIQSIDRRWIYVILIVSLVVSLYIGKQTSPIVMEPTQKLYDAVESAPAGPGEGKIILLGLTFSPSTLAESGNQARALVRHLILSNKRFAIIALEPNGAILGTAIVQDVTKQYGYRYGEDWISFGYHPGVTGFFTGFPRNIPGTVKKDAIEGKPIGEFPIMRGVQTIDDVSLFVDITASASIFSWITLVQGRYPLQIGYATTGVMVAEAYPFLDSGQIVGMLPGLKGAADYEMLVDTREEALVTAGTLSQRYDHTQSSVQIAPARVLMFSQSTAHLVIILFIIIGNVGLLAARRATMRPKEHN